MQSNEVSEWIESLANWTHFFTGTFRGEFSEGAAQRGFERFMLKEMPEASYFYVTEPNPSRAGHHVHALLGDCSNLQRDLIWKRWFKRFGRNKLELIRDPNAVTDYCTKHVTLYLTKGAGWYNLVIQENQDYAAPHPS